MTPNGKPLSGKKFPQAALLEQAEGTEKSSASERSGLGQNFFAINGLKLASVVCLQTALSLFIPGGLNLRHGMLAQRNQEHVDKA